MIIRSSNAVWELFIQPSRHQRQNGAALRATAIGGAADEHQSGHGRGGRSGRGQTSHFPLRSPPEFTSPYRVENASKRSDPKIGPTSHQQSQLLHIRSQKRVLWLCGQRHGPLGPPRWREIIGNQLNSFSLRRFTILRILSSLYVSYHHFTYRIIPLRIISSLYVSYHHFTYRIIILRIMSLFYVSCHRFTYRIIPLRLVSLFYVSYHRFTCFLWGYRREELDVSGRKFWRHLLVIGSFRPFFCQVLLCVFMCDNPLVGFLQGGSARIELFFRIFRRNDLKWFITSRCSRNLDSRFCFESKEKMWNVNGYAWRYVEAFWRKLGTNFWHKLRRCNCSIDCLIDQIEMHQQAHLLARFIPMAISSRIWTNLILLNKNIIQKWFFRFLSSFSVNRILVHDQKTDSSQLVV